MVPGWRLGWVVSVDADIPVLSEVKQGLRDLSTLTLGPSSLVQSVLPNMLEDTPEGRTLYYGIVGLRWPVKYLKFCSFDIIGEHPKIYFLYKFKLRKKHYYNDEAITT